MTIPTSHDHDPHSTATSTLQAKQGAVDEQTVAVLTVHAGPQHPPLPRSSATWRTSLSGEARHQMLHAVEAFEQANGHLSAALEPLEKKDQD